MSEDVYPYQDEISLRDIYLILRKGLPLILILALLAGVLSFLVLSLQPKVYEAESIALVTPPSINVERIQNLTFRPRNDVPFEAYETLALSRGVLERTVAAVPEANLHYSELKANISKLVGPQRPDQSISLLVSHKVKHTDPAMAARLADAWANATLETVRASFLENLAPITNTTSQAVADLQRKLGEAEAVLQSFEAEDKTAELEATTERLAKLIADAEGQVITTSEWSLGFADPTMRGRAKPLQDELLFFSGLNLSQLIAAHQAALLSLQRQPEKSAALNEEIQQREAHLAGLKAQQESFETQLERYRADFQRAQSQLADLKRQRRELERNLDNAESAYQNVVSLQPFLDYVTKLTPTNALILSAAAIPANPAGPRRLLGTVLATAAIGLLAVLFVFVREAVSPIQPVTSAAPKKSR